ncbi:MAG: polymerase subunit sigma [Gemmataceae bacterium]|nr:polymerase subunit sigma [Gemmataceae bacterium]
MAPPESTPHKTRSVSDRAGAAGPPGRRFRKGITVTRSPFDSYLFEINRTPLLTADEERQLAARIAAGDATARDHLARANLRLVVRLAREYTGKGVPLEDLIAEGNLGLMRAVEAFDPAAGTRFGTYAAYWVKQSIRVALNKSGHAVRLPQYMGTLLIKWRRTEAALRDELGRDPAPAEVAEALGLTPKQTRALARAQKAVTSGRAESGDNEVNLAEMIADNDRPTPEDPISGADDVRAALGSLAQLQEREVMVLRLRFGLDGEEPATLREVGTKLGLTRERARQIEQKALAALRERLAA